MKKNKEKGAAKNDQNLKITTQLTKLYVKPKGKHKL